MKMLAENRLCQTIEEVRELLEVNDKGQVKNTMQNVYQVFLSDPVLHGAIGYNILTGRIDICKPLWWERTASAMSDTDFNYLMLYLEKRYGLTNENRIRRVLTVVALQNQCHPIREYLNRLVWDGIERILYVLHHFLSAEICAYGTEVMRLFLLGAIHRVFRPGCKFELMLCLVGGQGAGKSTFFRFLACKDEWFSDDLKKIDDDNVFRKMQGHWIIEMSEMIATANARSIEDIKSFLSRSKETYKVPYATEPEDRLRQCVFGGTSNALDFLPLYRRGKVQLKLSKEMNEQLVLLQKQFMPEDHPLAAKPQIEPQDLTEQPFMLLEHGGKTEVSELLEQHQIRPDVRFTSWDDYSILSMVESGFGVAILPRLILRRNPYRVAIRSLSVDAHREIGLALRSRKTASYAVKQFLQYLQYRM